MIPYLITGGNFEERIHRVKELLKPYKLILLKPHPDLLIIETIISIGINQIREVQRFLSRKPYQAEIKAVFLPQAEKMTLPAQNSFLKTLEEPPENSLIILCAEGQNQLLATIVSRCQLQRLKTLSNNTISDQKIKKYYLLFSKIIKASIGDRLQLIEVYEKNREEAIIFCQDMILVLRKLINTKSSLFNLSNLPVNITKPQLLNIIKSFQAAFDQLQANVNIRLVIDNLIINLL